MEADNASIGNPLTDSKDTGWARQAIRKDMVHCWTMRSDADSIEVSAPWQREGGTQMTWGPEPYIALPRRPRKAHCSADGLIRCLAVG